MSIFLFHLCVSDAFSLDVMGKVQDIKKSSLTFAPEAGSQRLRDVINKGLTKEVILEGAGMAFEGGWNKVKALLYVRASDRDRRGYEGDPGTGKRYCGYVIMRFQKISGMGNARSQFQHRFCAKAFYTVPVGIHA